MSDFSEGLRVSLKERETQLRSEDEASAERRQEQKRRFDQADSVANDLRPKVFQPLLEKLQDAIEAEGVLFGGGVRQDKHGSGPYLTYYRAMGTAAGNPLYEIRISSAATDDGKVRISLECLHATAAESQRHTPETPIVGTIEKAFTAAGIEYPLLETWCEGHLTKFAHACLEKNRSNA